MEVIEIVSNEVNRDDEEVRRSNEPREAFHPSSVSHCERQIFLTKINAKTFDDRVRGSMKIGTIIHNFVQSLPEVKERYDIEIPVKVDVTDSPAFIVGSADLVSKDRKTLTDIKSINGLTYVTQSPMNDHIEQVNVYLKGFGIEDGEILYVNKTTLEMVSHKFKFSQALFDSTCEKVRRVYEALMKWENEGAWNNPLPFGKCGCFFCKNETIREEFKRYFN